MEVRRCNYLVHKDGRRELINAPEPALRWSKGGVLQRSIAVNYEREGGGTVTRIEWEDIPSETRETRRHG